MKIALFLDYFQPKLGYSEYYVAKALQKNGHVVQIITSDRYFPFPDYAASVKKFLGNRIRKPGFAKEMGLPVYREKTLLEFFARVMYGNQRKHLARFRPDTVIVNGSTTWNAIVLSLLKKAYGYRLISFDSHLPSELLRGNTQVKEAFYFLFRAVFSLLVNAAVDKFIAVQKDTEIIMRKYYGIRRNIALIPLGTDTSVFSFSRTARNRIRKKYHLKEEDFIVLYSGKIIEAKRPDLLFRSFNELVRKHNNLKLMLVGDGPADYIRTCYSFLDRAYHGNVIHIPFQKQASLAKYYSCADIGVWPAQQSTSIIDAQACGLLGITDDTTGRRSHVVFRVGDYRDLRRKVEYLYLHPIRRGVLCEAARQDAVNNRSWPVLAKKYIS